jgi:hypothetical protein
MLCLLCPTPDDQRPRGGGSDFESLFGDLVRRNGDLWWSITGDTYSPWSLPPDWYGDDDAEKAFYGQFETLPNGRHGVHAVTSATVFRDTMKYLTDFWLEVYAFREKPLAINVESWWSGDGLPLAAGIARGADHAFVNVDGSYWAALSSDEGLLRGFAERWPLARFVRVAKTDAG